MINAKRRVVFELSQKNGYFVIGPAEPTHIGGRSKDDYLDIFRLTNVRSLFVHRNELISQPCLFRAGGWAGSSGADSSL